MIYPRSIASDALGARPATVLLPRHACFLLILVTIVVRFWTTLVSVLSMALRGEAEHYSHIVMIPLLSLYLIYRSRAAIFNTVAYDPRVGGTLLLAGVLAPWLASTLGVDDHSQTVAMLGMVLTCVGAFVLCYGTAAFHRSLFPLLLLLFMVPLPDPWLHAVIAFLQRASAEMTSLLYGLLGVPVFRDRFVFVLPGLVIEVAEQCSGIRSSLSLLIVSLLAGYLSLRSGWSKAALVAAVIPLTIFKNAVRIVTLSLLAAYVDRSYITNSALHRNGGIPLFVVSVCMIGAMVWVLQRLEARRAAV